MHKLGLKFGIYEDYGNYTCGGYPGVLGHMQVSAGMGMTRVELQTKVREDFTITEKAPITSD